MRFTNNELAPEPYRRLKTGDVIYARPEGPDHMIIVGNCPDGDLETRWDRESFFEVFEPCRPVT